MESIYVANGVINGIMIIPSGIFSFKNTFSPLQRN
jgi:hypothetical protein